MVLADTARRGENGFSLIESMIAVAVLGIIVSAMVGGMATSIAMSDIHRQQSVDNAVMVSAAETVKNALYEPCAVPGYSQLWTPPAPLAAAVVQGLSLDAIVVSVQYWNPNATQPRFDSTCHDNGIGGDGLGGPFPMQLVTIRVTNPGNRASTSVDVIKRGP
jgi:prepilin-type N-terminal cleavage/methylation domain-containing protein